MKRIAALALDRPVGTVVLLVSLMVLGAVAVFEMPIDFMPIIKEPEVDIAVPFPGSHPLEALRQVALPIEEEVSAIPGVRDVTSFSRSGEVEVEVRFDWDANVDLKKMEVREAVERARHQLPADIGHIRVEGDTGGPGEGGVILQGRISAERDLSESWELLDRRIRRPLERIQGVGRVHLYGVERQELRVDLDLEALREHGVDAGEVAERLRAANLDLDLGSLVGDVARYDVRAVGRFRDVESVRELPLGGGVRLADVAAVTLDEPRLDYGRHLDRKFAVGIDVFKEPSANTVEAVDALLARIEEIQRDPALAGIQLQIWENAGEQIELAISGLASAGVFGGILAIVVLFSFLRRVSTTAIVAVAIPFSLVVTCGAMYMLGAQLNVLTMLGLMLGVGMLVDNAVVVIENIYRHQGRGLSAREAARQGSAEVALAVTASTATTVIVWSWLFVSERSTMTILMGQVALTICLAVVCSLLVSLTFIPLAAGRFVPKKEIQPGFLLKRLVPAYRGLLAWTLRHRLITLVVLLAVAGSVKYPISWLEMDGEPRTQEKSVAIRYEVHDPSSKEVLEGYVDQVEEWLETHQEELGYDSLYSWYSERQGTSTQVYLPSERATPAAADKLRNQLKQDLPVIAGVKLEVGDRDWFRRGTREGRRVNVALHGDDPEHLEHLAEELEGHLASVPGALRIYGPSERGAPEVRLMVDSARARSAGVTPREIGEAVSMSFRGRRLARFVTPGGEVEMRLGLPEGSQPGLAALSDFPIPRPDSEGGGEVPLGTVAEVEIARTAQGIRREARLTTVAVQVEFDEDEVTTEAARARVSRYMAAFALPDGYRWSWGDWGRRRDDSLNQMFSGLVLSLLLVVLLMAALFESLSQPLAIVITLPLAFFGAFWLLWFLGYVFDSIAMMGIIILVGIVVNNGIVLVDRVNHLRASGKDRTAALLEGCGDRLRPVLMTAITTLFGLVPLALARATVATAYIDSLAVAVMGGLATSTLFTLLALPVWYTYVEDFATLLARLVPRFSRRRAPAVETASG